MGLDCPSSGFKALFNEKYCSCCKKYFIPAPQHMYKVKGLYQCSYSCWRREGGGNETNRRA